MHDVLILADPDAVAEAAAEILIANADAALESGDRFVLGLSSTPSLLPLYRRLSDPEHLDRVPWDRTWIVFGDEVCVPGDHPASHRRIVRETLLDRVPVPEDRVLAIDGDAPQASRAAHFHEQRMRALFPDAALPSIDVALLGMDPRGATASLLPGSDALEVVDRWVTACWVPEEGLWRVALTLPAWNASRQALFLVTGAGPSEPAARAFGDAVTSVDLPAARIVPEDGSRIVLVDDEAAALLGEPV